MATKDYKKRATEIFKGNKALDKIYFNDRGEFFTQESNAVNSQKGKAVKSFNRATLLKDESK